jgi:hypothetical protein
LNYRRRIKSTAARHPTNVARRQKSNANRARNQLRIDALKRKEALQHWISLPNVLEDLWPWPPGPQLLRFLSADDLSLFGDRFGEVLVQTAEGPLFPREQFRSKLQRQEYRALYALSYLVRATLTRISQWKPEIGGGLALTYAPIEFPVSIFVAIDEEGRLKASSDDLFIEYFHRALEGLEAARIRRCPVCGRIYFAHPLHKSACSERCCAVERVRRKRDPRKQTEYNLNRKINRIRRTEGVSIGEAKRRIESREIKKSL